MKGCVSDGVDSQELKGKPLTIKRLELLLLLISSYFNLADLWYLHVRFRTANIIQVEQRYIWPVASGVIFEFGKVPHPIPTLSESVMIQYSNNDPHH